MSSTRTALALASLVVLLGACDGGYPSASRPNGGDGGSGGSGGDGGEPLDCSFEPCGGNLLSMWSAQHACAGGTGLEEYPGCEDAVVSGAPDFSGTLAFREDGTFVRQTVVSGDVRYQYDDDCVASLTDGSMDAATYCGLFQQILRDNPDIAGTCEYAGGTCACDLTLNLSDASSGTFFASGTEVSLDWTTYSYCVDGDELRIDRGDGTIELYRRILPD